MSQNVKLSGSCLCGMVRYEVAGEPKRFYHCHCSRCRKASGTGHATNMIVKTNMINWLSGGESVRQYKLPQAERFTNCFCAACGSPVPRVITELGIAVIPAGSLDQEPPIAPQARIYWDSRAQWSCGAGDLPVFAEMPV